MSIRSQAKVRKQALEAGYPKRSDVSQGKRPVSSQDAAAMKARKQAEALPEGNVRRKRY